jgi:hypothetical protein
VLLHVAPGLPDDVLAHIAAQVDPITLPKAVQAALQDKPQRHTVDLSSCDNVSQELITALRACLRSL